ncbi:MAG: type III-A CRISPR-associated RAMP protein Csm5 [Candidatus Helarchaeota archaeon]
MVELIAEQEESLIIELKSPVHIGNGNEFQLADFYIDSNKRLFYLLDQDKFLSLINEKYPNFLEIIENPEFQVNTKYEKIFSIEKFINKEKIEIEKIKKYCIPIDIDWKRNRETKIIVHEFIKNPVKPYIPGSSLKGAIRTALLWNILNTNPYLKTKYFNILQRLDPRKRKMRAKFADDMIEKEIFGKDPTDDILKSLQITDSSPMDFVDLEISEIGVIGNPNQIPIYLENLKAEADTSCYIKVNDFYYKKEIPNNSFTRNVLNKYMTLAEILKACNEFSKAIIEEELTYQYYEDETISFYNELLSEADNCRENEAILRFSWGSGWNSTTVGLITKKFPGFEGLRRKYRLGIKPRSKHFSHNYPKTRKVKLNGIPLGWIKISY